MSFAVNGTTGITFNDNTNMATAASLGPRNRIINGNMAIDQRNAGAAISAANLTSASYTVDRWQYFSSQTSKFNAQQNQGAVTGPTGFSNYLGLTSQSAYSVLAGDYFGIRQQIEGFNVSDLAWGTSSAKTVTLSFLVYSSLTGTFGGAIYNIAGTRSYPFSYSVPSANTWTTISITISGDTSGTWVGNTNGSWGSISFGLGAGSTYTGTSGVWASAFYTQPTSTVSVVGTSGATFYITGVQLEVGSVATPYQFNTYSDQLAQCQRYFVQYGGNAYTSIGVGSWFSSTRFLCVIQLPVPMRAAPTATNNGFVSWYGPNPYGTPTITSIGVSSLGGGITTIEPDMTTASATATTAGVGSFKLVNNSSGTFSLSAEL